MTKKIYQLILYGALMVPIIGISLWPSTARALPATSATNQVQTIINGIPDIPAKELKFSPLIIPANSKPDNNYISIYNKAINYFNQGRYEQAIPILKTAASRYNDQGRALYLLGLSYYYKGYYDTALQQFYYALDAGYDSEKVREWLTQTLFKLGYRCSGKLDYRNAIGYYKAALQYQDDEPTKSNIVYCYLQYAKASKSPANVVLLLYAYDFIQTAGIHDDSLEVVANNLSGYILNPPLPELFDRALVCIKDSLAEKDDPYLHQTLGFIYLYQNNDGMAKAEFKKVIDDYKNSEYYPLCLDKYHDIGTADYRYHAEYPVFISGDIDSLPSLEAEVILLVPQTYPYQTTRNLKLYLNDRKIPYEIVTDKFGTKCLSSKISNGFVIGENVLAVECDVQVESRRVNPDALQNKTLSSYDPNDLRFKLLTARTETADILDPRVQKIIKEIRKNAKSAQIKDLVREVYDYVLQTMEYRIIQGPREKVNLNRALVNNRRAICEDYAILTVTLLRALQIPAAYYSGDTYNQPIGHAWAVFYTPDYHPIPLDTTWADTSEMPEFYFLRNSNLNAVIRFSYDSELMPEGTNIKFYTTSGMNLTAELGESSVKLRKVNE